MAEDEELRIKALREELMRKIETVGNDVNGSLGDLKTDVKVLKYLFGTLIAVFSLLLTIIAFAADVI